MAAIAPLVEAPGHGVLSVLWTEQPGRRLALSSFQFLRCPSFVRRTAPLVGAATMCLPKARVYDAYVNGPTVHSARDELGSSARSIERKLRVVIPDARVVQARDYVGAMLHVLAPQRGAATFEPARRRVLHGVAAHLGAGLRLRRGVSANIEDSLIEARFDANGRCVDAAGPARDPALRERLRAAAARHERAQMHAHETLDDHTTWTHLVSGRWSLVDRFESDGKRYVLVYRNPPGVLDPRRLTTREAVVATHTIRGANDEETARALGVSASSVRDHVAQIVRKLGLRSRLELPSFYATANRLSRPLGPNCDLAVAAREQPDRAPRWWHRTLTPAEHDIARQILDGASNRAIAERRGSRPRTVANQIAALYAKLRVHSRGELRAKLTASDETAASPREAPGQRRTPPT
ncbi:MAG: helix-turn-helix transcriptional regulator [Myxococcales bacterium FL481]|nr:MAG: helix-turn-helix transcriptional regulator [Myxococcales bacterium FL481]